MLMLLALTCLVGYSFGANILFVDLVPSPSHHIWNELLVEGLLGNGHNITKTGSFPATIKSPRYTQLFLDPELFLSSEDMDAFIEGVSTMPALYGVIALWRDAAKQCDYWFASDGFKRILDYPKNFFDLMIFDVTFAHCYLPLVDYFGRPPVIGVTAFGMQPYINRMIGQRTESYVPFHSLPYINRMGFLQRLNNVFHQTAELLCNWYFMAEMTKVSRAFFGKHIPNLIEYEKIISLIFSNDDPVLDFPKTFPPNVIPIGGMHVTKPKKLDDDLQKIMDGAAGGVVFVSMGSNIKAKHYNKNAERAFVEAFSRLNLTVLWKFEGIDVPENVVLRKWFSQTDILAHSNTKLFITHCGLLSTQETMIRGVPVIGLPLFADQFKNGAKIKSVKGGIILQYSEITGDGLYNAITEVLSDPGYKQNMMKLSTLYRNQPQQPLGKFLLWTEYVLKNGHLDHLSVSARDMEWYEVDNWDILAFSVISIGIIVFFLKRSYRFVKKMYGGRASGKKRKTH